MKIDFHVHAKITTKFDFDEKVIEQYIQEGKKESLDAFVLTEHCHTQDFRSAYEFLKNNYNRIGDCYIKDNFKIFTGIEITTKEKFDVLVISDIDYIYDVKEKVDKIIESTNEKFIEIEKLIDFVDEEKSIIILAHPYRRFDEFPEINESVFNKFDAVEYNATDLYKFGIDVMKKRINLLGQTLDKKITAGSDTHHFMQIGSVRNVLDEEYTTCLDLKKQINSNNLVFEISDEFRNKIEIARKTKEILCGKS